MTRLKTLLSSKRMLKIKKSRWKDLVGFLRKI